MAQILSISSNVVAGHVGNSTSVFALQRLGHMVWPIHTITLPFHLGIGPIDPASRQIMPSAAIDATFQALETQGWLPELDAILIGYMATPEQSQIVAKWVSRLKSANPELTIMVDPILGDDGALYVSNQVADAAKTELLPLATILKPNRFELQFLTAQDVTTQSQTFEAALSLGVPEIVVTSAPAPPGMTANFAITPTNAPPNAFVTETANLTQVPKGTGDLFGALYLSARLKQASPQGALEAATNGIFAALNADTVPQLRQLALIPAQASLVNGPYDFKAKKYR